MARGPLVRPILKSATLLLLSLGALLLARPAAAAGTDVVLYTSDVSAMQGNWSKVSDSSAAGGQRMTSADLGWSQTDAPLGAPNDYFEATFTAPASTTYHVWLRLRATGNSKWNDSVFVQFSNATDTSGQAAYRIGTTAGLAVNLATDASGSSLSGWGWEDKAYWTAQSPLVQFIAGGTHTIRVQTREDGVQIDQIILSPANFLSTPPGGTTGDSTIVAKSGGSGGGSSTAYSGTPVSIPGTIALQNFDNGGEGVAYHDTTSGNTGGAYRSTDVDLGASADGGNNVGWTAAGEWLNYSVNVASAGSYSATFRVASSGQGGTFHLEMNGSNVSGTLTVPDTGGWQVWKSVTATVTLAAGAQVARLVMDSVSGTGAVGNFNSIAFTKSSGSGGSTLSSGLSPYSGTPASVPGTIEAENFDNGGEGVAYHDTTSGNNGGAYRSTDVDLEASSEGGFDVGWAAAGEWLNYTVNVATSGTYTVQLRVASNAGGTLHVGFNGPSNVWSAVSVPATGGYQSWSTVSVPVTISAGTQQITILFDTGGVNLNSITVSAGSGGSGGSGSGGSGGTSSTVNVATWNIEINDGSDTHARAAMDALVAISPRPQVIVIVEAYSNLFNTYIDELQRQTGQTWHGVFATHCAPGTWNGSGCSTPWYQGVGIFSTYDITGSDSMLFPFADCWTAARVGVRAQLNVNGTALQVFATHLQTGGCEDDAQLRYSSMAMLKSWASNFSGPMIAAGDFNADPDQIDTTSGMLPTFVDSWSIAGSGKGYTAFVPTPTMKIDYWFEDAAGRAAVQSTAVITSTGSISDHYPVRATFKIQ
jgi:endonuclease/exonuclease/phosphatase family metal-dependent hydrolase